jgi:hypothetical protein
MNIISPILDLARTRQSAVVGGAALCLSGVGICVATKYVNDMAHSCEIKAYQRRNDVWVSTAWKTGQLASVLLKNAMIFLGGVATCYGGLFCAAGVLAEVIDIATYKIKHDGYFPEYNKFING